MKQSDLAKAVNAIDALGAGDDANADPRSAAARHASDMADLLSESSGMSRQDTLNWLLYSARGNTLFLRSLGKRLERRETKMKNFKVEKLDADQWQIVAKADPNWFVQAIEKGVKPAGDPFQLTNAAAKAAHPDMTEARAFAKFVDEHPIMQRFAFAPVGPYSYLQGEPLRKTVALEAEPQMSLTPTVAGGLGDFSGDAYEKLASISPGWLHLQR